MKPERDITDASEAARQPGDSRSRIPYGAWPRGLNLAQAAVYCGVSSTKFRAEIDAGVWPKPETRGGRRGWDRHAIDRAWDRRHEGHVRADPIMEALDDSQD